MVAVVAATAVGVKVAEFIKSAPRSESCRLVEFLSLIESNGRIFSWENDIICQRSIPHVVINVILK